MRSLSKLCLISIISLLVVACKSDATKEVIDEKNTTLTGTAEILVDDTVYPLLEDLKILFEEQYTKANIVLKSNSSDQILNALYNKEANMAIISRAFTKEENEYFMQSKRIADTTWFATDAIAFVVKKEVPDSTITHAQLINLLTNARQEQNGTNVVVFDNANSSSVDAVKNYTGINSIHKEVFYAAKNNVDVLKYVTSNSNAVGVIGINWLFQPSEDIKDLVKNVKVLAVENVNSKYNVRFVKPNQTNIADGSYPLRRRIYMVDLEGKRNLGLGFSSYIAGQIGQRVVLKSGLMPSRIPSREIVIRSNVE